MNGFITIKYVDGAESFVRKDVIRIVAGDPPEFDKKTAEPIYTFHLNGPISEGFGYGGFQATVVGTPIDQAMEALFGLHPKDVTLVETEREDREEAKRRPAPFTMEMKD